MSNGPLEIARSAREMETIAFRPLADADSADAAEIIRAAFAAQSQPTDPPSSALKETAQTIAGKIASGGGVCAMTEGAMIALALWRENDGALHIGRLSVLPGWRGRGLARALIEEIERQARAMGLKRLGLNVRLALGDNQRLFAALGFRRVGLTSHAGFSEPTIAIMERPID
jgi:GNAT superfamily N-acetyltransferase